MPPAKASRRGQSMCPVAPHPAESTGREDQIHLNPLLAIDPSNREESETLITYLYYKIQNSKTFWNSRLIQDPFQCPAVSASTCLVEM